MQPVSLWGSISVIFGSKSHYGSTIVREMKYKLHNTAATKQWTADWPYIAHAFSKIYKTIVNKVNFVDYSGGNRPLGSAPACVTLYRTNYPRPRRVLLVWGQALRF